ncbi:hypothetical protein RJ639_035314, partial [Escallonia herrerae]
MASQRIRDLIWRPNILAKRARTVAAAGFAIFLFALSFLYDSRTKTDLGSDKASTDLVPLTLLRNAHQKGACTNSPHAHMGVCLDTIFRRVLDRALTIGFFTLSWNKVKIRYCDGGSFAGNPESEFKNGTKLFFRGQLIWEALMDQLLSVGLSDARQ